MSLSQPGWHAVSAAGRLPPHLDRRIANLGRFVNLRTPTLLAPFFHRLAILLALLGQSLVAFGLPLPALFASSADAVCGCSEADRTAGRCCCAQSGNAAPCCRKPTPPPRESVPSCCAVKKSTTAKRPSCCQTPSETPPGKPTDKPAEPKAKVHVLGGIIKQRCTGVLDHALAPLILASIPPQLPLLLDRDQAFRYFVPTSADVSLVVPVTPSVPPPRTSRV